MDGPSFLTPTVSQVPQKLPLCPITSRHIVSPLWMAPPGSCAHLSFSPQTRLLPSWLTTQAWLLQRQGFLDRQGHTSHSHTVCLLRVLCYHTMIVVRLRIESESSVSLQGLCKPLHSEVPLLFVSMRNCKVQRLVDLPPLPLPNIAFTSFHTDGVGIYLG